MVPSTATATGAIYWTHCYLTLYPSCWDYSGRQLTGNYLTLR
eukprot:gene4297-4582_t